MGMVTKAQLAIANPANTPNVRTPVASYRVPRGLAEIFDTDHPVEIYLPTKERFHLDAEGGRTQYVATLAHTPADNTLPQNRRVIAVWNGTATAVLAINVATKAVTCTVTADAGDLDIFYLPAAGKVEVVAEAPAGSWQANKVLYANDLDILHAINQYSEGSVPVFQATGILPQDYRLVVYVTAPFAVDLTKPLGVLSFGHKDLPLEQVRAEYQAKAADPTVSLEDAINKSWVSGR